METESKQHRRIYFCRKDSQCCQTTAEPKGGKMGGRKERNEHTKQGKKKRENEQRGRREDSRIAGL
jgi:hypothetical protein